MAKLSKNKLIILFMSVNRRLFYVKKIFLTLFLFMHQNLAQNFSVSNQNLIPDPGFEINPFFSPWFIGRYFVNVSNPFNPFNCNIMYLTTKNVFGTQLPKSGNCYLIFDHIGFGPNDDNTNFVGDIYHIFCYGKMCAFIATKLKDSILKNHVYRFTMYYSRPECMQYLSNQGPSLFFTDSAKIMLSYLNMYYWYGQKINSAEYMDYLNKYPNHLLWDTTRFMVDETENWVEYTRCFKSKSDELYMMMHWWGISNRFKLKWVYDQKYYNSTACPGYNEPLIAFYLDDLSLTDEGYYGEDVRCMADTFICPGASVVLQTNHEWNSAATYEWYPPAGLDCSICPFPVASPSVTTTYRVKKTLCDYVTTDSVTIYVKNLPPPPVFSSHTLCPGDTLKVNISEYVQPYVQIGWMPYAYATCSDCAAPAFFPPHSVQYTLNLSACNQALSSFINLQLLPEAECEKEKEVYFFPQFISPNNDGKNDELDVKIGKALKGKLEIYNRWDNLIFQTENMKYTTEANLLSWDGTYGGKRVPAGTYFYLVKWTNGKGEDHIRKEFLHVLY
jgi:gliding motility-associated-like protein